MTDCLRKESNRMRWVPWGLILLSASAAYLFVNSESEVLRRYAAGAFGASLGGALLFWGAREFVAGRIRGKRVYVHRKESPFMFTVLILGKRLLPGAAILLAGFWYVFLRQV